MNEQATNPIVARFNHISWHDSELRALCFCRTGEAEEEEQVRISLHLQGENGNFAPAEIIFRECAYIEAEVFLEAKAMCSDAIHGAECFESSDWKDAVSRSGPYDIVLTGRGLERFLHFSITLCPPGGTIDILARDFALEVRPPA